MKSALRDVDIMIQKKTWEYEFFVHGVKRLWRKVKEITPIKHFWCTYTIWYDNKHSLWLVKITSKWSEKAFLISQKKRIVNNTKDVTVLHVEVQSCGNKKKWLCNKTNLLKRKFLKNIFFFEKRAGGSWITAQ